jgi:hypothetical protein
MHHSIVTTLINAEYIRMQDENDRLMRTQRQEPRRIAGTGLLDRIVYRIRRNDTTDAATCSHGYDCDCLQRA